jgi:hypothetical protein
VAGARAASGGLQAARPAAAAEVRTDRRVNMGRFLRMTDVLR